MMWIMGIIILYICDVVTWTYGINYLMLNAPDNLTLGGMAWYGGCIIVCTYFYLSTIMQRYKDKEHLPVTMTLMWIAVLLGVMVAELCLTFRAIKYW